MTFAERDELAMELWKEGENHVLRRDWPGARKARLRRKRAGLCNGTLRDRPDAGSGGRVIRMIPDRGVDFYITGTEIVEVHFPNGDLACQWCPFCKRKTFRGNTRVICVKTYEPLNEIYETRRGDDCPLAIQEVDT